MRWIFTLGGYDHPRPIYPQAVPGHRSQQGSCLGLDKRLQDGKGDDYVHFRVPHTPF